MAIKEITATKMVVGEASINNIMGGIENTGSVRLHNHKRKLKQRFDIIKKLGQGTYGKVQLGINKETGQEVAIKTIKKSKIETEADLIRIRREIQIMSSVQHPNIIHIYEVFENREKMVLVMEYAAGGELYDYLSERKVLIEEEARRIFRQISTACYYCHKHKICHRDLKLENILLDEHRNAKIADFGLSNVFDDQRLLSTFCGSPLYASPEIVKGTPYHGPEVDCWSLGVLLYTLVYGAMPFDGSNFKRLVKQISQGDYFEPKKPSPASPLIQEMLTVNAKNRADIEKICAHWWVNEGYDESCLEISEELANQTPVRLDVLLSLNPPPAQLESEKLVVTGGDVPEEQMKAEAAVPTRSQSVGSLMEVTNLAEKKVVDVDKMPPKRKLETTVSSDQANISVDGKRKEKIVKEHTVADISVRNEVKLEEQDVKMSEAPIENAQIKENISIDPSLQGAACAELMEEAKVIEAAKATIQKTMSANIGNKIKEETNESPSQESLPNSNGAIKKTAVQTTSNNNNNTNTKGKENVAIENVPTKTEKIEVKSPVKKIVKKKVLTDKNDISKTKPNVPAENKEKVEQKVDNKSEKNAESPTKPMERRQSRIFEQAEKFQSMITSGDNSKSNKAQSPEKPKKIVIPGVSVGGFKKEFERKASLTSVSPPKIKNTASKKLIIEDKQTSLDMEVEKPKEEIVSKVEQSGEPPSEKPALITKQDPIKVEQKEAVVNEQQSPPTSLPETAPAPEDERKLKLMNAVSIISNALDKEGTRKSKSRPCMGRKPPVPFGASGRSASGSISMISPLSPPADCKRYLKMQISAPSDSRPLSSMPEQVRCSPEPTQPESKTSSAEITLKSATLPRRKSTKAEIQLDYPKPKPATMEFKTEMAHQVQAPPKIATQRSEVMFPVNNVPHNMGFRSSSLEPESKKKERIIPIAFDRQNEEPLHSPPMKPPVPRPFQTQKSNISQRSNSLSRQSTLESDSEISGDPIKKSPREYIIPIAVEGGGYVTPRAGSLEPSDTSSTVTNNSKKTSSSKFGRPRRMMSLFDRDGSEDESSYPTLHRHSSFGKDSDTEGDTRNIFHMHRLRSSRPRKAHVEHTDSLSSGEDDDDDDAFEFLTAENLFSTLLSRVRGLTQKLNVDDGSRPGFPSSRLLTHFDQRSPFWNRMEPLGSSRNSPLGRQFSRERSVNVPTSNVTWRRSVSRDLASDIDNVFNDPSRPTVTRTTTLPRGDKSDRTEKLNLSDLNLKKLKLTEEDALALSYLTPGLSKRIQKQLFASLPPSEVRKISRTLSMRNENDHEYQHSGDRVSATLPRKFSFDKRSSSQQNLTYDINQNNTSRNENQINNDIKSYLPTKIKDMESSSHSESYDSRKSIDKPRSRYYRATSLREPTDYKSKLHTYSLRSPDSSLSEMSSLRDDDSLSYAPESTSLSKYMHRSNLLEGTDNGKKEVKPTRKISRFLRPDFYDTPKEEVTIIDHEKKDREMETQKVLKEIRDKRIKNRISMRRERSLSREKSLEAEKLAENKINAIKPIQEVDVIAISKEVDNNGNKIPDKIIKCKDLIEALTENSTNAVKETNSKETETILNKVSDNIKNIETNVLSSAQNGKDSKKISKLIRPKSYPAESTIKIESNVDKKVPKTTLPKEGDDKKMAGVKRKVTKVKKTSPPPTVQKDSEKVSTKNKFLQSIEKKFEKLRTLTSEEKKDDKEKKTGVENTIKKLREQSVPRNIDHITESTLIKRAVSVEDFSNIKSKALQPSRKSVSKILNLFKKYEDKKTEEVVKNGIDPLTNITETNIPVVKSKLSNTCDDKSSERNEQNQKERPKSLLDVKQYNGSRSDTSFSSTKVASKLPRKSFILDKKKSIEEAFNNNNQTETKLENTKMDRKNLKLDFTHLNEPSRDANLNRVSYGTDESPAPFSPGDDSCDSWSVCSDFHHTQELMSPVSPNGNVYNSGDENESVIDRIRRKSFYSRFNEKKKQPRKSSLVGNYKDLDLYKDYNQKTVNRYKAPTDYNSSFRRSSGYSSSGEGDHEYRPYVRAKSLLNDYVNVPNRYQTYNPRRSNISTLYSSMSEERETPLSGTYKKYSYSPNTTRLGSVSRTNRSPSSDFQYAHLHGAMSEHSSTSTPTDNSRSMTEHAI